MYPDRRVIYHRAQKFLIDRWVVAKGGDTWYAFDPAMKNCESYNADEDFYTFAEAIEYAQKQARQ